jgi:hypothetical protein
MAERISKGWQASNKEESIVGSVYPKNMGAMMRVEELGNWNAVSTFINTLPPKIRLTVYGVMDAYAHRYKALLKEVIRNNGGPIGGWAPLNREYRLRKTQNSNAIYRYSEVLYKHIIVESFPSSGRVICTVAQDAGVLSHGKMSASQVAHILESGSLTHNIPARPLFKPTWKLMGGNAALGLAGKEAISMVLKKEMNNAR